MEKIKLLLVTLLLMGIFVGALPTADAQSDQTIPAFWDKFSAAVIKGDKAAVAGLSQFPLGMPYGQREIRNRAQLLRLYSKVFNGEADAAKCFRDAKPITDPARPKEFQVACKFKDEPDEAAGTPIVYIFARGRAGWKFTGLDNINE